MTELREVRAEPADLRVLTARPLAAAGSRYAGVMRYPGGGGLTAAERARRERGQLPAACDLAQP